MSTVPFFRRKIFLPSVPSDRNIRPTDFRSAFSQVCVSPHIMPFCHAFSQSFSQRVCVIEFLTSRSRFSPCVSSPTGVSNFGLLGKSTVVGFTPRSVEQGMSSFAKTAASKTLFHFLHSSGGSWLGFSQNTSIFRGVLLVADCAM